MDCDLDKVKSSQVKYTEKEFSEPPTGVEPMTFQKYQLDALNTELWETRGEQGHILGSYTCETCPANCKAHQVEMIINVNNLRFSVSYTLSKSQSTYHLFTFIIISTR